jgi:phthiocerol/phenolphthiocerol synthesis type-I polyketide synthase E
VPPVADWDAWTRAHDSSDPASRAIAQLRQLQALGAEVLTTVADAGDESAMRRALEQAESRFGAVHGVFHAAALTAGRTFAPITDLDHDRLAEQFGPKVGGARALADALNGRPLDFCIVMSSVSTLLGGLNFGAYAAANAALEAVATGQARQGRPWTSIIWDGWTFAEAATGASTTALALTPAEGLEALTRLMDAELTPRTIVSTANIERRLQEWVLPVERRPEPVVPIANSRSRAARQVGRAPDTETERTMATIWAEMLGVEAISTDDDFFALGGHSLLGTRIMSRVRDVFRVDLGLQALFDAPTIVALSASVDGRRDRGASPSRVAAAMAKLQSLSAHDRERLLQEAQRARRTAS